MAKIEKLVEKHETWKNNEPYYPNKNLSKFGYAELRLDAGDIRICRKGSEMAMGDYSLFLPFDGAEDLYDFLHGLFGKK